VIGFLRYGPVVLTSLMIASGPALAANTCEAPLLTCATTMPVGGYCECTARGQTHDGTVTARPARGQRDNATAGGCGAHPNAPGCR
jgi:hypothetical protein